MYKIMKFKKRVFFVFIFALFIFLNIFTNLDIKAKTSPKLNIKFTYGYGNHIKANKFLPINLSIKNTNQASKLKLILNLDSINGTSYEYIYYINLEAQENYEKTYPIYIDKENTDIFVSLYQEDEKIYSEKINIKNSSDKKEFVIGVLSDYKEQLNYFDDLKLNYDLLNTKLVNLYTKSFPKDSINLQQIDLIIISSYRLKNLSYDQSMALMDWVKNGGIMMLGTGSRVDDTLGRYAPELLDEMYEKAYMKDINLKISAKEDKIARLNVVDLFIHGGNVILSDGDFAILSSTNRGKGKIIVAAYDFVELSKYMTKNDAYVADLLSRIIGKKDIDILSNDINMQFIEYFDINAVLSVFDASRIPNLPLYFMIIAIYILLSGPVLFILLKQNNLLNLYTKFLVASSIFFSLLIFLLGNMTRYQEIFYNFAKIIDVNEDYISQKIFLNINNPYNKDYKVNLDKNYSYQNIKNYFDKDKEYINKEKIIFENQKDNTSIQFLNTKAFQNHIFKLESRERNPKKLGISGYINLIEDNISGYIENNYDFDLECVSILFYSKVVKIGDIKAHEVVNLEDFKLINIPLNNNFEVAKYLNKQNKKEFNIYDEILDFQKNNLSAFYMNNFFIGYSQDAKIIAFAKNKDIETKVIKDIPALGLSLFSTTLNVDNRMDDKIYRWALIKNPSVLTGEYYADYNTYYAKEPLVLEYNLGLDVEVSSLNFEYISNELDKNILDNTFNGNIYIYDYIKEQFIKKERDKNYFTQDELSNYLSDNNSIRVKYSSINSDENQAYLALPMLSILGIQK